MPGRVVHPLPAAFETPSNLPLVFERLADTFTPRPGLEPFRLPVTPRRLEDLFPAFGDEDSLDCGEIVARLNAQTLLYLEWSSCGLRSTWSADVAVLRDRRRLYLDATLDEGPNVLAVAPPDFTRGTDLRFLDLLAASNTPPIEIRVAAGKQGVPF